MNIYEKSGYLNIPAILELDIPFNFIVGGRGTGKTYGALKYVILSGREFMLMRRTQTQTDYINRPEFSPFKPVCEDLKIEVEHRSISPYNTAYFMNDNLIGYSCALSTISNLRGFIAPVSLLIYDEFISERHERPIKEEGAALLNAYETLNRNRELKGQKPMQLLCMANAFNIANPVFLELGLVGIAEKMKQTGQEVYINRQRGVAIFLPHSEKIAGEKRKTALYKLAGGAYADMALNNNFAYNPTDFIKSQPLAEYRPVVTVGEITIYRHKSGRRYYVSEHETGKPQKFNTDNVDLKRFIKAHGRYLYLAYMKGNILFENMLCKSLFETYIL